MGKLFGREKFDYKFECLNLSDYSFTMTLKAEDKILMNIFQKGRVAALRKKGIDVKGGNPAVLDGFVIEPIYYNYLTVTCKRLIAAVGKEVGQDGVALLSQKVTFGKFVRRKDRDWDIVLKVEGMYSKQ